MKTIDDGIEATEEETIVKWRDIAHAVALANPGYFKFYEDNRRYRDDHQHIED